MYFLAELLLAEPRLKQAAGCGAVQRVEHEGEHGGQGKGLGGQKDSAAGL